MKRRVGACVAGACVAGLMAGMPMVAFADEPLAGETDGVVAPQGLSEWIASENMNVDLYGPPPTDVDPDIGKVQPLYGAPVVIDMPQLLYGPPSVFLLDNPMIVRTTDQTVKASRLAKKAKTIKKAIVVKKAKGEVRFVKVKKASSSELTLDKATGAITVAKGTMPGDYTLKVRVKAAGTSKYNPATKAVVVKVRVK